MARLPFLSRTITRPSSPTLRVGYFRYPSFQERDVKHILFATGVVMAANLLLVAGCPTNPSAANGTADQTEDNALLQPDPQEGASGGGAAGGVDAPTGGQDVPNEGGSADTGEPTDGGALPNGQGSAGGGGGAGGG